MWLSHLFSSSLEDIHIGWQNVRHVQRHDLDVFIVTGERSFLHLTGIPFG